MHPNTIFYELIDHDSSCGEANRNALNMQSETFLLLLVLNCLAGKIQSKTEASIPFDKFSPGAVSSLANQQEGGFDPKMPAFNINITESFIVKIS